MRELLGKTWLVYLLLAVTCLITFAPGLRGPFVFDDTYWQSSMDINVRLHQMGFLHNLKKPAKPDTVPYGRPLLKLLFASQCSLFAELEDELAEEQEGVHYWASPTWPFHAVSIIIHLLNAVLVLSLLKRLLPSANPYIHLLLVMIWALHPLQTDAVLYVSQQSELLVSMFILLTLNLASRHKYKLAVLTCFVGMFCKELMVVTPLLTWLAMSIGMRKHPWQILQKNKAFFGTLSLCCLVVVGLMWVYPRSHSTGNIDGWNNWNYLLTQSQVLCHYLLQCVWPSRLSIDPWFQRADSIKDIWQYGLAILSLLIITGVLLYRRHRLGFWAAWFFIILAPTSSFIPITTEIAAQRRMYLPLLGVLMVLMSITAILLARIKKSGWLIPVWSMVCLALAVVTFNHSFVFQSQVKLYEDTVSKFPDHRRAIRNLGAWYFTHGKYENALQMFERVLDHWPNDPNIHTDRVSTLIALKRKDQALLEYERLSQQYPNNAEYLYLVGEIYALQDKLELAEKKFKQTLAIAPHHYKAMSMLATIYGFWGKFDDALALMSQVAVKKETDHGTIFRGNATEWNQLGILYARHQQWDKSIDAFHTALYYCPDMTKELLLDIQSNLNKVQQKKDHATTPPPSPAVDAEKPDSNP